MIVMMRNSFKWIKNNTNNNEPSNLAKLSEYSNSIDEVYAKYNCVKTQVQFIDDTFKADVIFAKDLFEENNSNEEYFERIIKDLVRVYNRDFVLKDTQKNIIINVIVNSSDDYNYTINNLENYFEKTKEKNKKLSEYEEIKTIDKNTQYYDFETLRINNWSIKGSGIKAEEKGIDHLKYKKYKVLTNNTFVNTIILNSDFEEEIIEGIKFGEDFNTIEKKVGKPTFTQNDMIGYKINNVYVFFYKDEVAIYPNIYFENLQLENLITKYLNNEYSSVARFSYDLIHTYLDFNSYVDDKNTVILESPTRGIKMSITQDRNLNVEIYNNYDLTEVTKKYIREDKFKTNFEIDLVYEHELNRR